MQPPSRPTFIARCRACSRVVLAGVERIGDAETAELRAHAERCWLGGSPSARARDAGDDLGALLARFDVVSTEDGT